MPSPFPGMDPYLERPSLWPDVHARFIPKIQDFLNPQLGPNYVARIELRVVVESQANKDRDRIPDIRVETAPIRRRHKTPIENGGLMVAEPIIIASLLDEEIEEAYLTIQHRESKALVAVLEVLSPSNKIEGSEGRKSFMEKRREVLLSHVHWIEIDFLRSGSRVNGPIVPSADYRILISRGDDRQHTKCWPISVRQKLPVIGIPLRGNDPDVPLDLAAVLDEVYDGGAYERSIDYKKPPEPTLKPDAAKWAVKLLRSKGLR